MQVSFGPVAAVSKDGYLTSGQAPSKRVHCCVHPTSSAYDDWHLERHNVLVSLELVQELYRDEIARITACLTSTRMSSSKYSKNYDLAVNYERFPRAANMPGHSPCRSCSASAPWIWRNP